MPDIFDKAKRSEVMSKIRSKNTKAERAAFRYLRKKGVYFQKHYGRIAGSPDIALPRKKLAVFIDGDFWHGRHEARIPTRGYWRDKILSNRNRDRSVESSLIAEGWRYMRVWESDIMRKSSAPDALLSIEKFLLS